MRKPGTFILIQSLLLLFGCNQEFPNCNDLCKTQGRCESTLNGCIAISEKDCQKSTECLGLGHCAINTSKTHCIAASINDCLASNSCKQAGACSLDSTTNSCAVKSIDDCYLSVNCKNKDCELESNCSTGGCYTLCNMKKK